MQKILFCFVLFFTLTPLLGCNSTNDTLSDSATNDTDPVETDISGTADTTETDGFDTGTGTTADTGSDTAPEPGLDFPDGFLWGTATAGFQVDMGCPSLDSSICQDPNSDWYQWVTDPQLVAQNGLHLSGDPINYSPGHWEMFEQDFEMARTELASNSYRMSLEWSRLFPEPTFNAHTPQEVAALANQAAVDHYREMFAALAEQGIKPLVTVHHYTLPIWIHDGKACHFQANTCTPAGWLEPEILIPEMTKYARFVAETFGSEVDLWATLNEPLAVVMGGYLFPSEDRTNPPGIIDVDKAATVLFSMIEAHARVYEAVVEGDLVDADGDGKASQVGLVYAIGTFRPKMAINPLDQKGAENAFQLYNRIFLDGAIKGELDTNLDGEIDEVRDDLVGKMDYLGVNYYFRTKVIGLPFSPFSGYELLNFLPSTFEEDPEGMYEAVTFAKEYGLPMIITENGTDDPNEDDKATRFLVSHLHALHRAIDEGADVRGYFYWSLMDNYEWNHGMDLDFGLLAVDPLDPQKIRTPKANAAIFKKIAQNNTLSFNLIDDYSSIE